MNYEFGPGERPDKFIRKFRKIDPPTNAEKDDDLVIRPFGSDHFTNETTEPQIDDKKRPAHPTYDIFPAPIYRSSQGIAIDIPIGDDPYSTTSRNRFRDKDKEEKEKIKFETNERELFKKKLDKIYSNEERIYPKERKEEPLSTNESPMKGSIRRTDEGIQAYERSLDQRFAFELPDGTPMTPDERRIVVENAQLEAEQELLRYSVGGGRSVSFGELVNLLQLEGRAAFERAAIDTGADAHLVEGAETHLGEQAPYAPIVQAEDALRDQEVADLEELFSINLPDDFQRNTLRQP